MVIVAVYETCGSRPACQGPYKCLISSRTERIYTQSRSLIPSNQEILTVVEAMYNLIVTFCAGDPFSRALLFD